MARVSEKPIIGNSLLRVFCLEISLIKRLAVLSHTKQAQLVSRHLLQAMSQACGYSSVRTASKVETVTTDMAVETKIALEVRST